MIRVLYVVILIILNFGYSSTFLWQTEINKIIYLNLKLQNGVITLNNYKIVDGKLKSSRFKPFQNYIFYGTYSLIVEEQLGVGFCGQ